MSQFLINIPASVSYYLVVLLGSRPDFSHVRASTESRTCTVSSQLAWNLGRASH